MKNNTRKFLLVLIMSLALLVSMATVSVFAEESTPADDGKTTIYFENNWLWTEVCCYYWGSVETCPEFPGSPMNLVGSANGHEVYSFDLPADATSLIISGIKDDGSGNRDQTPDIVDGIIEGAGWKMLWVDGNQVESFTYNPNAPVDPTPTPTPDSGTVYTVAGVGTLCFSEWDVADTYNDMTYNEETGLYEKTFTGIPAGDYECKVAANHSWDQSWGGESGEFGNYGFTTYDEHDITITFDPVEQKVGHVLSASTGPDEDRPVPEAPDIDLTDTIRVYLADSANWGTAYFYCWTLGSADQNATWPGLEMSWDSELLLYYADVPTYYQNIIFNNGSGTQTADLAVPGDEAIFDNVANDWSDMGNYTPPVPPENTTEDVTVTVRDDAGWGDVYIYYWDADGIEAFVWPGSPMELDENGNYTAVIPAGYYCVIFNNGGSWEDGTLKQTPDLLIPTDGKTWLSNGSDCLYNDGTADDNDAWYAVGGNGGNGGNTGDSGNTEKPDDQQPDNQQPGDSGSQPEAPKQPTKMTFIQKVAKAILLFLRKIEGFFKGIFKK